jgi:hypothetical protein
MAYTSLEKPEHECVRANASVYHISHDTAKEKRTVHAEQAAWLCVYTADSLNLFDFLLFNCINILLIPTAILMQQTCAMGAVGAKVRGQQQ